jgi:hypothetical protein
MQGAWLALGTVGALALGAGVRGSRQRLDVSGGRLSRDGLDVRYAHRYVSPRERVLTPSEAEVRAVAYQIKDPPQTSFPWTHNRLDTAGRHLAALISDVPGATLVPVPSSSGDTQANMKLAEAIARHAPGAVVCDVLRRRAPVPSSMRRRKRGLSSLSVEAHDMVAIQQCVGPAFLVDNVFTTGNTLRAAKAALGHGEGLVWAAHLTRGACEVCGFVDAGHTCCPPGSLSKQHFTVRSPAQGLKVIQHKAITDNYKRSLRVKPTHKKAVLVPCAGTKPFPQSPSHKHGYLPAVQDKDVDVYVVSEPLGVVPYAWSTTWPNDAYDFPPEHLKGAGRNLLVDRIGTWLDKVGGRYDKIVLALPSHHMRLVRDAAKGRTLPMVEAGVSACKTERGCSDAVYRATHGNYSSWLGKRVGSAAKKRWWWDEDWWLGDYKTVSGLPGGRARIYRVGKKLVAVYDHDFDGKTLQHPTRRWTFRIEGGKIVDLRMHGHLRRWFERNAPDFRRAEYRLPDYMRQIERDGERALQTAYNLARMRQ